MAPRQFTLTASTSGASTPFCVGFAAESQRQAAEAITTVEEAYSTARRFLVALGLGQPLQPDLPAEPPEQGLDEHGHHRDHGVDIRTTR